MKKSCYDCFSFITKIPLINNGDIINARLDYKKATAICKEGLLTKGNKCELRVFKNVLTTGNKNMKTYEEAEKCSSYEGDE